MKRWALTIVVLAAAAVPARAQDVIPWPHRDGFQPMRLVTQSTSVQVKDQVARVTIDATFHNPNQAVLEGMYYTTIPGGAEIDNLTMMVNGKEMAAELLDSKKARDIYNAIVHARRDPALLELVGHQMIKLSIFPINPGADVQVKISWTQMLEMDGGLIKFQTPFGGAQEASLSLAIESKKAIKTIYSPTHNVDVQKKDDHNAKVEHKAKNSASRKDLVLYYALNDQDVSVNLLTYREPGEDGYFILLASPKVEVESSKILPKDIVFVYDRSGSMSGEKMRQGQEALQQCLNSLNPADRFTVVDFSTEVSSFEARLVEASKDNILRAQKYVEKLRAAGSTNIDEALQVALALLEEDPKRVRMIFFLTDGLPTVGEQRMDNILKNVEKRNEAAKLCRIFVFGVGLDVNTLFLDKMAEANRGAREYVQPEEKIEGKVSALYDKVSNPILSGLVADFGKIQTREVYPRALPDLFKGTQVVVFGRYSAAGPTVVKVKGTAGGDAKEFAYEVTFPEKDLTNDFLPRLWAGRKVAYLVDSIRLSGRADKEVIEEIVALGKKYAIVTPYTSFLITEEDARKMDFGHGGAESSGKGDKDATRRSQAESKKLEKAKDAPSADSAEDEANELLKEERGKGNTQVDQIRFVGTKVFYLKNRIWVDGAFDAEKMKDRIQKVPFLSEAYLKLIDQHEGIQKYLAVGDRLILVWGDKVIEITSEK